jgi:hypothetical protein
MPSQYAENDGRFPDDSSVEVWYPPPGADHQRRETWAWLPGTIAGQCAPDEWHVWVDARELATLEDGSPAPEGTKDEDLYFPGCFREASELRKPQGGSDG